MLRRTIYSLAIVALIAGCSSGTKLNDAPVVDRSGGAGSGGGGAASGVAPVTIDPNAQTAQGPVGVARIVYFDFDSYTIKPEFQSLIDGHARFLKANPQRRIAIEGHTDERGGREYNLALGQKRSEAVRRALNLLGVSDNQIEAVSFGKEKPAAQGTGEDAWAQNRRAEITYRR
ncbi:MULTISPECIES: peptidoglycan-associated lipoprotein Pal [unclassified Variovorax]|uniref:peptidoglycan-associated lipoprotein Pal n=1 Tax=unclassified Variovorax TaxID=663243 RepID=UPI00076D85DA|nr:MULTISPECIES: peptidoglycan-associated lipoprotein Pal [unclassified Variovorax]KWT65697.1 18K peptidoglycan-associated outer membrane lipoprotein [Variovorax sp. WDL1]PNG56723.1 Peptidoglycan-associated lipoprotein [Variovorax sp. B4]PNG58147.1 Peptidoglycan-associated lipoprotein [Variovorax sp. B2]VTV09349.1 Peptidoglycan-associated lipoprotein precursor [Variovorax sp. WDL1]